MRKTLILCFIHGFKGGESTFGNNYSFVEDLRRVVGKELPDLTVKVLVYPKYETRGDLGEAVSRFRSWLEEKVIDYEVARGTASPTVEPSVRIILIGHSMGGIVAAETVMGLASEKPIYTEDGIDKSGSGLAFNSLMFPRIQGVLAFDTPYLGIAPGVVAYGAEGHYQSAQSALAQLGSVWKMVGGGGGDDAAAAAASASSALTTTPAKVDSGGWGWGKIAMYGAAAGAVAAGSAAAWMNRDHISTGWSWVSSHLEFVGCLARPEALKQRVGYMVKLSSELNVGFANLYTRLGKGAENKTVSMVGTVLGKDRTFCVVPSKQPSGKWIEAINDKAADETTAHITMFEPENNPAYEKLLQDSKGLIASWVQKGWHDASHEPRSRSQQQLQRVR
ncbi:alpha beta-hydrolase [Trichoderma arundinaceum]|uniref:Alpha beta-hydrolase n=1 Tax=Trichoderma arundinaceum TaxID=490622 RepID=A0A395NQD0_TRIAR|nr:alpha beta-hydrolase [Trichoderma arundinaceum]